MCRFCKRNIDRAKRGCLNREAASIFASEPSQLWFDSCASISAVLGIRVHPKAATVRQRDQSQHAAGLAQGGATASRMNAALSSSVGVPIGQKRRKYFRSAVLALMTHCFCYLDPH